MMMMMCTWTVAAWRMHIPFSLGITVVFSLSADVSQMACYGINCKVTLNWSVAFSYAHVLCARLYISWTTLITPHTYIERSILARCIAFILQSNCTMHYDNSKLTETRTNRGSGGNVELLPTIKKNSANNKDWPSLGPALGVGGGGDGWRGGES